MNRRHIIRNLRAKGIAFDHNLSTIELNDLLNGAVIVNKISRTTQFANGRGNFKISYNASKDDEPVQVMVCEDIGKDAWSGEGFCLKDLQAALEGVDKTRALDFLIDSPGGYVNAGKSIRNWLSNWGGVINQTIIGVAASTASWCIPADTTRAYKNSQVFMHRAMAAPFGNVDDLQEAITQLNKTDGQIADMYAEQSGSDPDEMLDLMKGSNGQGTLLTGKEALAKGLVDELIDGDAKNNFTIEWLNSAREKLSARNSLSALPLQGERKPTNQPTNTMKEKIALLNKRGIAIPQNATEAQLDQLIASSDIARNMNVSILNEWKVTFDAENSTDAQLVTLIKNGKPPTPAPENGPLSAADRQALTDLRNQLAQNRRNQIHTELLNLASAAGGNRIPVNDLPKWEEEAIRATDDPVHGNSILNILKSLPASAPGIPAINDSIGKLEVTADIRDIARGFESYNAASKAWQAGNDSISMMEIRNQAVAKANFFKKMRNRLLEVMNTNTIAAELKRQVILQDVVIRDFARRVVSLNMFSTVFRDIPLQGLNTVEVPYFDLDTSASTSFVSGTGYTTIGNTVTDKREITVGEGAANGDRLFQALSFSSQEIARQPYLKIAELAGLKAEKLAFDIWQDILSIITAANFGAAAITKAAGQFDSDQLALLKLACKAWPDMGRGLILDSAYDANLLQDPSFKFALNAASDSAIKEGRLFPRVMGFDYTENPNIPANGENLVGFAVWKYAILVAFAPVPPVDEVRNAGTVWEMIIDPATGITLEYRRFGNNVTDAATNVIESSYGFAKGLGTGLKRIVSA